MASDKQVWWSIIGTYPPMKPYLQYLNITESTVPNWSGRLVHDPPLEAVLGGNPDLLNKTTALNWFRKEYPMVPTDSGLTYLEEDEYKKIHGRYSYEDPLPTVTPSKKPETVFQPDPSVDMGLSIIPTASAEPEPISLPSVYGAQYVPDVVLQRPGELYTSLGQTVELSKSVEYKRVKIIDIATGIVVFDGSLTVENIKLHQDDPRYRVEFVETGSVTEPEPEPVTDLPFDILSVNVKISFTDPNIGGFSSSIPVNDAHQLNLLSSKAPEWKYTLIGGSPNPPLTSLNDLLNVINNLLPDITEPDEPEPDEPEPDEPEPDEPEPEEPVPVGIPGKFNTGILVGLLAGGALVVPILDDLLKTKKKRR